MKRRGTTIASLPSYRATTTAAADDDGPALARVQRHAAGEHATGPAATAALAATTAAPRDDQIVSREGLLDLDPEWAADTWQGHSRNPQGNRCQEHLSIVHHVVGDEIDRRGGARKRQRVGTASRHPRSTKGDGAGRAGMRPLENAALPLLGIADGAERDIAGEGVGAV